MGSSSARLAGTSLPVGRAIRDGLSNIASTHLDGPVRIGSFPAGATPDGVHDLIGNVWEWTGSTMRAYPGGRPLADSAPRLKVIRGGAFNTPDALATAWYRAPYPAEPARSQLEYTGFRCMTPVVR